MKLSDWLSLAAVGLGAVPGLDDKQRRLALQGLQGVRAVLKSKESVDDKDDELQKGWVKLAKKLEKEKKLTNEERISWVKPKVRADLYLRDGKMPDDNSVTVLAEGAVAMAKFD